jgi:predicted nucleotide-binding protein (sugar kinase/HSP70/actin superfamily)
MAFLQALGIELEHIVFSSYTRPGKGDRAAGCCYPVTSSSTHVRELLRRKKGKIDLLLCPMIYSLPSLLNTSAVCSLACPRVTAAPENIRVRDMKDGQKSKKHAVRFVTPLVSLGEPALVSRQLHQGLKEAISKLSLDETHAAVSKGYSALRVFNERLRRCNRRTLERCADESKACMMILARPYHMDPGISHGISLTLMKLGVPVLWAQYFPADLDLLYWMFEDDLRAGAIASPFEVFAGWPHSNHANSNEILWGAELAARMPWVAGVIHLASGGCELDRPIRPAVQQIVEQSGTLFYSFNELGSTRSDYRMRYRVEKMIDDLGEHGPAIVLRKKLASPSHCPLIMVNELPRDVAAQGS